MWKGLLTGAALAGIGAALVWQFYPGFWKEPPAAVQAAALQRRHALVEAQQQAARATPAPVQPAVALATCDLEPIVPPGDARDGRAAMEHPFPGGPRARAKVFLRQAEAAAARGRPRDAEVALLAACREHEKASPGPTVPLARVLGMLGERYVAAAGAQDAPGLREQLMGRAHHVLRLSAQAYASALGPNASRSRQARQRLAALEEGQVVATDVPQASAERPRSAPPPKVVSARKAGTESRPAAQRALPAPLAPPQEPEPEPARERANPQSHPELGQLASDLARLQAQAAAVSEDPAGFQRRAEAAQARRAQCRDAACLQEWYASRRRELLAEF